MSDWISFVSVSEGRREGENKPTQALMQIMLELIKTRELLI